MRTYARSVHLKSGIKIFLKFPESIFIIKSHDLFTFSLIWVSLFEYFLYAFLIS